MLQGLQLQVCMASPQLRVCVTNSSVASVYGKSSVESVCYKVFSCKCVWEVLS